MSQELLPINIKIIGHSGEEMLLTSDGKNLSQTLHFPLGSDGSYYHFVLEKSDDEDYVFLNGQIGDISPQLRIDQTLDGPIISFGDGGMINFDNISINNIENMQLPDNWKIKVGDETIKFTMENVTIEVAYEINQERINRTIEAITQGQIRPLVTSSVSYS